MPRSRAMAAFGRFLAAQRRAKELSAEGVVRRMLKYGVRLDQSTLYNYEAGTVNAPDPGVLWALSKIYGVSFEALVALLVDVRNGQMANVSALPSTTPETSLDDAENELVLAFRRSR